MAIERQNRKAVIMLLFLAVVVGVAVLVYKNLNGESWSVAGNNWFGDRVSRSDYLALQAENTLLKKMLGQIAGQVVILGPSSDKVDSPVGKIVWDKATQGGYLFAKGLPDTAVNYSLWMQDENGERYYCGVFSVGANGEIQSPFQPSKPVFKPKLFFIAKGTTIDTVVLRGSF
ncbi:MAG: hypothetical protein LBH01_04500 [Verrucomicrobiales bacterium]|jgi:hypothetical protein|nr:hypothetical protein [Verrucomicrobiales bacterium]